MPVPKFPWLAAGSMLKSVSLAASHLRALVIWARTAAFPYISNAIRWVAARSTDFSCEPAAIHLRATCEPSPSPGHIRTGAFPGNASGSKLKSVFLDATHLRALGIWERTSPCPYISRASSVHLQSVFLAASHLRVLGIWAGEVPCPYISSVSGFLAAGSQLKSVCQATSQLLALEIYGQGRSPRPYHRGSQLGRS